MNAPLTAAELAEVFRRSGMSRPVDDPARLQRMIDGADETVTAWDGGRLVGVARAVTDYAFCCCLSDLAVDPEYQGQGVGSRMVQLLCGQARGRGILRTAFRSGSSGVLSKDRL
ncbi:GNAT superfamily N-acetyltransferase [Paenibacillus mucilaginosus]